MAKLVNFGQYLVDDNPDDRVFVLPTLPASVDQANMLYGSTFSNCVRKTDLDNMTQRWLSACANFLKRGKKNRKLLQGNLACDMYISKSTADNLNHLELASLFQSLIGTVVSNFTDISVFRIRIKNFDADSDDPYVVGHIREIGEDNTDTLFPEFTSDYLSAVLDRLRPVD